MVINLNSEGLHELIVQSPEEQGNYQRVHWNPTRRRLPQVILKWLSQTPSGPSALNEGKTVKYPRRDVQRRIGCRDKGENGECSEGIRPETEVTSNRSCEGGTVPPLG